MWTAAQGTSERSLGPGLTRVSGVRALADAFDPDLSISQPREMISCRICPCHRALPDARPIFLIDARLRAFSTRRSRWKS